MKEKIRTICPKCRKSKNFYLMKIYRCNTCSHLLNLSIIDKNIFNLKKSKKLILPIILIILLISGCNLFKPKPEPKPIPTLELKVKFLDENSNPISASYSLEIYNNISNTFSEIKSGKAEPTYNIISSNLRIGQTYKLSYWTENHYKKELIIKKINANYLNTLSFGKEDRKGKISMDLIGNLDKGWDNIMLINISVEEGSIKRISVCLDYSLRIIEVKLKDNSIFCNWVNFSFYPHNGSKYFLENNRFRCTENSYIETCKEVTQNKCFQDKKEIPDSLKAESVTCFNIGTDITDNLKIPIIVKTMLFLKDEFLTVYLLDEEKNMFNFTRRW